jgi:hypothetical protein
LINDSGYVNCSSINSREPFQTSDTCRPPGCSPAANKTSGIVQYEHYSLEISLLPDEVGFYRVLSSNITLFGRNYTIPGSCFGLLQPVNDCRPPPDLGLSWSDQYWQFVARQYAPYIDTTPIHPDWIQKHAVCQPTNTYVWGFSNAMLLTFFCATWFVTVVLVSLHWIVYDESRVQNDHDNDNVYRDALDLATELRKQIGGTADQLSAKELKQRVGRPRMYVKLAVDDCGPSRIELRRIGQLQWRQRIDWKSLLRSVWPWRTRRRSDGAQMRATELKDFTRVEEDSMLGNEEQTQRPVGNASRS